MNNNVKSEINPVKKTEKFDLEKFTIETFSNVTVEKGIIISCVIFTIVCGIIGFWYLIFRNTNNQKYYNMVPKMNSRIPDMHPRLTDMQPAIPITSSINKFMFLD